MTESLSNRHESDLGGKFLAFGDVNPVAIKLVVSADSANLPATQHTAWMVLNILVRLKGIVREISVSCPREIPLAGKIVPLAARDIDLRTALINGALSINAIPINSDAPSPYTVFVGAGGVDSGAELFVNGNAWCGGVSKTPIASDLLGSPSPLPFGPYVGACIAGGEIFKMVRIRDADRDSPKSVFYSAWEHRASEAPIASGPSTVSISLDAALAGVGAVGSTLIHALWACPGLSGRLLTADNDPDGIELTNLNRYPLFDWASLGKMKASRAAEIVFDAGFKIEPVDVPFEELENLPPRVISAVDRNTARLAVQQKFPARLFSASTLDLRAEVLRCGPPGIGACLRCYNEPERIPPDETLRQSLKDAPIEMLQEFAAKGRITLDEAKEWVNTKKCGLAGDRMLPFLRGIQGGAFAVGFTSVMAGTLLTAEVLKDNLPVASPLNASLQRAVFQFFRPLARKNRAAMYPRDPKCPACMPTQTPCKIWKARYEALKTARS